MPITVKFTGKSIASIRRDLLQSIKQTIPQKIKVKALEHYHNSFQNQGFTDSSFQPWRPRKAEKRATFLGRRVKYGRKDSRSNRGLLVKTGRLRRSVMGKVSANTISIFSDVPYAQIHNDGGLAGRNHSAKMPRRRFLGESRMLNKDLQHMITIEMKNALSKS